MQFGRRESESDLRTKLLGALLVTILSTTVDVIQYKNHEPLLFAAT